MGDQLLPPKPLWKHMMSRPTINLDFSEETVGRGSRGHCQAESQPARGLSTVDHKEFINSLCFKKCFPEWGQRGFWLTSKRCLLWCPRAGIRAEGWGQLAGQRCGKTPKPGFQRVIGWGLFRKSLIHPFLSSEYIHYGPILCL